MEVTIKVVFRKFSVTHPAVEGSKVDKIQDRLLKNIISSSVKIFFEIRKFNSEISSKASQWLYRFEETEPSNDGLCLLSGDEVIIKSTAQKTYLHNVII